MPHVWVGGRCPVVVPGVDQVDVLRDCVGGHDHEADRIGGRVDTNDEDVPPGEMLEPKEEPVDGDEPMDQRDDQEHNGQDDDDMNGNDDPGDKGDKDGDKKDDDGGPPDDDGDGSDGDEDPNAGGQSDSCSSDTEPDKPSKYSPDSVIGICRSEQKKAVR